MRHQDLTLNHRLESWVYTDTADREGATGIVAADVGRISYQTDTGQYWRLTDDSPVTWQAFGPVYAYTQTTGESPAGTTSTSGEMMGLGAESGNEAVITPTATGKIFATIQGNIANATASINCFGAMLYGTGAAPVNGAATTGTALGFQVQLAGVRAANVRVPFSTCGIVTGAALGTELWFDMALITSATGTASIWVTNVVLAEIP